MKSLFTFCLVLFTINVIFAHNGSIRGSVQDATTKNPLSGAHVILENTNKQTYTDELGFYQFNNLEAGNYTVIISYLGYEMFRETVDVRDSETSTVRSMMQHTGIDLQSVTISPEPEIN
ncbi:MAG: carboxypeptidase-like regulatory domain-containing protein, partial [Saprospiraceae bacterium]